MSESDSNSANEQESMDTDSKAEISSKEETDLLKGTSEKVKVPAEADRRGDCSQINGAAMDVCAESADDGSAEQETLTKTLSDKPTSLCEATSVRRERTMEDEILEAVTNISTDVEHQPGTNAPSIQAACSPVQAGLSVHASPGCSFAEASSGLAEKASESGAEAEMEESTDPDAELVSFKVIFNKKKYDVTMPIDHSVLQLKQYLEPSTKVLCTMQKIMIKGPARDTQTLRELRVTPSTKCMMIGSTVKDVMSMAGPSKDEIKAARNPSQSKEPLCKRKVHARVLEKYGKPDDVLPGIKGLNESLPKVPLTGMITKSGGKVRLTFKLEVDQLWIGTKDRTNKVPMGSVKHIISEPIEGQEEYHIMGIQLGPTEASCFWVYWVPAQYVSSIKDTILGGWQGF